VVISTSAFGSITFSGTSGSLAASATFDTYTDTDGSVNYLTVLLQNTSTVDVTAPNQVLSALFWDPSANLTPVSALLPTGTTVLYGPNGGGNVGGEWAFKSGLSGAPSSAGLGISSSGLSGLFCDANFNGPNLGGPVALDGIQYGITSAGDNSAIANGGLAKNAIIKDAVLFTLKINSGTYDLSSIHNVTFQYGTSLSEPQVTAVPEPTTMIAGALLLLPFGASTLRVLRRRTA
jgi:hypothetical protein